MKKIKKKNFWFWGFIILFILNISIISSMGYFHYQMKSHGEKYHSTMMKKGAFHANKAEMRKKFWSDIEFTKEERIFLKNSRKQHFERMKILRAKLSESQSSLFNEIRKSEPDTNKIKQYKAQSLNTQEEIIDESIFFYENLKTKLNDEQMKMINSHLSKKFHSKKGMKKQVNNN